MINRKKQGGTSSFSNPYTLFSAISLAVILTACGGSSGGGDTNVKSTSDTVAPVITIVGVNPDTLSYGTAYVDPGATANDNVDGSVSVITTGTINATSLGEQSLTYTATDKAGNSAEAIRTVSVVDLTAPIITLTGDSSVTLFVNSEYIDTGATATDNVDSSVTVTPSNDLNTSVIGTYTYTYRASDAAGNNAVDVTRTITVSTPVLTGTAAAGAAIVGTVTVKDSLGDTSSALIEANGDYTVDVSGLIPPFRLQAQGTVGGKTYKLHSYVESATPEGTVNITPFTDLIIANAAQQVAEEFFDAGTPDALDPDELAKQENALQAKLQNVFNAVGLDTAIDLLSMSFSADHSGLDAALDLISIETDPTTNTATITNILDNSSIEDDISNSDDNDTTLAIDEEKATTAVTDTIAIANLTQAFGAQFEGSLPTSEEITPFIATSFLNHDESRGELITELTTSPLFIDLSFTRVSVRNLNSGAGTAIIDFNTKYGDFIEPIPSTWHVIKEEGSWKLNGNQLAVDLYLNFHCGPDDENDNQEGFCFLNTMVEDFDFSNNGTNGKAFASATVSIVDGETGEVKDIIYLGTSEEADAGEMNVYNQSHQSYESDFVGFGDEEGEVNPSIFKVGDLIEYRIYEANLDLTNPSTPLVDVGNESINYSQTLWFLPETSENGKSPSVTAETLTAMEEFSLEEDFTLEWTTAAGTWTDEVAVIVYDDQGNEYEIWEEFINDEDTSLEISMSALLSSGELDTNNFTLEVRVYSMSPLTEQTYSRFYTTNFTDDSNDGLFAILTDTSTTTTGKLFVQFIDTIFTELESGAVSFDVFYPEGQDQNAYLEIHDPTSDGDMVAGIILKPDGRVQLRDTQEVSGSDRITLEATHTPGNWLNIQISWDKYTGTGGKYTLTLDGDEVGTYDFNNLNATSVGSLVLNLGYSSVVAAKPLAIDNIKIYSDRSMNNLVFEDDFESYYLNEQLGSDITPYDIENSNEAKVGDSSGLQSTVFSNYDMVGYWDLIGEQPGDPDFDEDYDSFSIDGSFTTVCNDDFISGEYSITDTGEVSYSFDETGEATFTAIGQMNDARDRVVFFAGTDDEATIIKVPAAPNACSNDSSGGESAELIGSWYLGDSNTSDNVTVTFYDNGYYAMAHDGILGDSGEPGMERGTYTWDKNTGEFNTSTIRDTNGEWGFSHMNNDVGLSLTISDGTFSLVIPTEDTAVFTKINKIEGSLVGSWYMGDSNTSDNVTVTFYDNGYYAMAHDGVSDDSGGPGMERGTYTWDKNTGEFNTSTIRDTNGEWGFSHMNNDVGLSLTISDGTFSLVIPNEEAAVFTRVVND